MSYQTYIEPSTDAMSEALDLVSGFIASFRWALEVHRRCEREMAPGRRLDADAIRRIGDQAAA